MELVFTTRNFHWVFGLGALGCFPDANHRNAIEFVDGWVECRLNDTDIYTKSGGRTRSQHNFKSSAWNGHINCASAVFDFSKLHEADPAPFVIMEYHSSPNEDDQAGQSGPFSAQVMNNSIRFVTTLHHESPYITGSKASVWDPFEIPIDRVNPMKLGIMMYEHETDGFVIYFCNDAPVHTWKGRTKSQNKRPPHLKIGPYKSNWLKNGGKQHHINMRWTDLHVDILKP